MYSLFFPRPLPKLSESTQQAEFPCAPKYLDVGTQNNFAKPVIDCFMIRQALVWNHCFHFMEAMRTGTY